MRRTLGLAAVFVLIVSMTIETRAQNLEAGKSPGQIFSATCTACHRSPRGLLKSVPPASLPGFLREHYTTSRDMAQQLSGFLIANGASDPRARQDIRNPQETRRDPRSDPRQAQPDGRVSPQPPGAIPQQQQQEPRPGEAQQAAPSPDPRSREGRRLARQAAADAAAARLERRQKNRRNRITPESRIEAAKERGRGAPALGDVVRSAPSVTAPAKETATPEVKPDIANPEAVAEPPKAAAVTPKPDAPKQDLPKQDAPRPEPASSPSQSLRADPVPQVTPAPPQAPPVVSETHATPAPSEPRAKPSTEETSSARPEATPPSPPAAAQPGGSMPAPPISQ